MASSEQSLPIAYQYSFIPSFLPKLRKHRQKNKHPDQIFVNIGQVTAGKLVNKNEKKESQP
ncbi:MAG: hypothetical protein J5I98_28805, partial [Phaeodactylibacter sp.]|nr:hypothetical protein [Phaeodactylibacter sp.]